MTRQDVVVDSVLVAGIATVLALPIAARVLRRAFDPFEPVVVFGLAWGVMFVVRPAAILVRDDTSFYGVDIGATLDSALLLGLLGAVGFVAGHELSWGRRLATKLPRPPARVSVGASLAGAVLLAALGVASLALFLLPSGGLDAVETFFSGRGSALNELLGASTTYLWWGSLLVVPAALIGFAVAWTTRTPGTIVVAGLLVGVALLRIVPVGNRVFLLPLLGGMAVFTYLHAGRRPRALPLVVTVVLALFLSYAVLQLRYPDTRRNFGSAVTSLAETPSRMIAPLTKGADAEMAPALAGALRVVPSRFGYRFGRATVGDLLVRPVPREWWAGKPETPGHEVVVTVWPKARTLGGFDPAFTPLLHLFWDFSLAGVLGGMLLFGAGARALVEYLRRHPDAIGAQLVFALGLWYVVVAARFDPVSVVVQGVILFVPLLAVLRLASRQEPAAVAPATSS